MDDSRLMFCEALTIIENTILLYVDGSNKSIEDIPLSDFLRDVRAVSRIAYFLINNTK